jgi:hypothetical protein
MVPTMTTKVTPALPEVMLTLTTTTTTKCSSTTSSNYTSGLQILSDHRYNRFENSIATNPYFFAGPIASQLVTSAAHHFIFRLMGNKSAEYPEGQTTPEVFKSWFAVTGDDDDLTYTVGHEVGYIAK